MVENQILNLTGADASKTITGADLAILPFGSIEYHGPHAPLGTDSFIAQELASRVGKRLNAIMYPLIAYTSCPTSSHRFPGTLHIDPDVMTAMIESIFRGLLKNGVRGLLALNAHDGNIDTIKRAADRLVGDYPDRFILLINWWQTLPVSEVEPLDLFSQFGGHGHGGPLETSAAWAVAPATVQLNRAEDIDVDFGEYPMIANLSSSADQGDWRGYSGRVSESSIEKGFSLLKLSEDKIVELLQEFLMGS